METKRTSAGSAFLTHWKLRQLSAVIAVALGGCAGNPPLPAENPASPPPSLSAPQSVPSAPVSAASLDALFPVGQSRPLFDGESLRGWKITDFAGHGDVAVDKNINGAPALLLEQGAVLTGVTWTNPVPNTDYEVELDAMKLLGSDFFCGLTFPFGDSFCTFICGGWGGAVVGLSSIDGEDASMNETTKYIKFDNHRWYHVKVRVTKARIEAWIDADQMADVDTTGKKISMRLGEIEESAPFGIAAFQTRAALRNITLQRLAPSR